LADAGTGQKKTDPGRESLMAVRPGKGVIKKSVLARKSVREGEAAAGVAEHALLQAGLWWQNRSCCIMRQLEYAGTGKYLEIRGKRQYNGA